MKPQLREIIETVLNNLLAPKTVGLHAPRQQYKFNDVQAEAIVCACLEDMKNIPVQATGSYLDLLEETIYKYLAPYRISK